MENVLVRFDVFVCKSDETPVFVKPDYVHECVYCRQKISTYDNFVNLEVRLSELVRAFKNLGYKVTVLRHETTHICSD